MAGCLPRFEVGQRYQYKLNRFAKRYRGRLRITRRTPKTVWFVKEMVSTDGREHSRRTHIRHDGRVGDGKVEIFVMRRDPRNTGSREGVFVYAADVLTSPQSNQHTDNGA